MNTLFTILTILIVIASVLLTLVVLLQSGKGEGMASNFVSANQTLGVRQTADLLEKVSWGLMTFILVVSIITSFTITGAQGTDIDVTEQIESAAAEQQLEFPTAPLLQADPAMEAPAAETPVTPAE
ncbi:MAG: preprotein translocase subunit SecG [Candidatus Cryptobacteroides sp.]|jgi:preprotein translocase subunit SecG|nr:preprotein translocase subunit SecG [Bacteroidota bacterium]NLN99350.1 preprotein translocase subunit SecG [Bacteroidales bacterium]